MAGDELIEANHYNSKQCMMIKEISSLKKLYYDIVLSTQEANNSLLNALKLLNALSSSIKDKSVKSQMKFNKISNNLDKILDSLFSSLTSIIHLGDEGIELNKVEKCTTVNINFSSQQIDNKTEPEIKYEDIEIKENIKEENDVANEPENVETMDDAESFDNIETMDNYEYIDNEDNAEFCDISNIKSTDLDNIENVKEEHKFVKEFKCDICEYKTSIGRYLIQHKKIHNEGKYKCEDCDYITFTPYKMKSHVKNKHQKEMKYLVDKDDPNVKYFPCVVVSSCSYKAESLQELDSHVKSVHNKKKPKHLRVEGSEEDMIGDKEYQCDKCSYKTFNKIYFDDHLGGMTNYWKCPFCDVHFKRGTRDKRITHLSTGHDIQTIGEKVCCNLCDKILNDVREFDRHVYREHDLGTEHHCNKCKKTFKYLNYYLNHQRNHKDLNIICSTCGVSRKNQQQLSKHIYEAHEEVKCEDCGIMLKNRNKLFSHRKKHHVKEEDMYVCEKCAKSFPLKSALAYHVQNYHATEILKCEKCEYTTTNSINLRAHKYDYSHGDQKDEDSTISTNSNRTKVTCQDCGISVRKSVLARHMKVKHSDQQPSFKCTDPGCSYATYSKYSLKLHKDKVHEGIRWPCDMCDYVGGYKGDLKRHQKVAHDGFKNGE